ncbi:MAG: serine protease [Candidatus Obscuribacterales bacterium]|nr:serine protease [Candidatus Obscuribacterales bacterium]
MAADDSESVFPAILCSVSKVDQISNAKIIGSASGFFYEANSGKHFFVTNKHVVTGSGTNTPERLRLKLHADTMDLKKSLDIEIPLFSSGKPVFLTDEQNSVDLALIPVDNISLKPALVTFISSKYVLPDEFVVSAGEDVIVVGYPLGFSDSSHNLPLFRSASVASVYGVNFQGQERCVLDGNIQPGMSGSPIFMKPVHTRINKKGELRLANSAINNYIFVGILSQVIPVTIWQGGQKQAANIGLVDCWYPYLLEKIASKFKS